MSIERFGTTHAFQTAWCMQGRYIWVEVPSNLAADVVARPKHVLASVDCLLAQAGSDRQHLLMATIYLDMADYDGMNAVWDAWCRPGAARLRGPVFRRGWPNPEYRVEIAFTAARISLPVA